MRCRQCLPLMVRQPSCTAVTDKPVRCAIHGHAIRYRNVIVLPWNALSASLKQTLQRHQRPRGSYVGRNDERRLRRSCTRRVRIWTRSRTSPARSPSCWCLSRGLGYAAFSIVSDMRSGGRTWPGHRRLRAAGARAADRAGLRVRQRLPRHRQRGRHRDLHPQPAAAGGGDLVGLLQLPRRADLQRRGRLHASSPCCRWS